MQQLTDRQKKLVFGYIRNILDINIPEIFVCVCCVFYWEEWYKGIDLWNKHLIAPCYKISGNKLKKPTFSSGGAFLSKKIKSGRHYWTFKINKYSCHSIHIGIFNLRHIHNLDIKRILGSFASPPYFVKWKGYVFDCAYGRINNPKYHPWDDYAVKCRQGCIITMYVDFYDMTLSFSINGKDYGISHAIKKSEYSAAMCFESIQTEIEIIEYGKSQLN
eukprot:83399_1